MKKVVSVVLFGLAVLCFSWAQSRDTYEGSGIRDGSQVNRYYVSHAKLPFGCKLLITNLANGKQSYAFVGGRISKNEEYMFSLSPLVADALGAPEKGAVKLRARVVTKTEFDTSISANQNKSLDKLAAAKK